MSIYNKLEMGIYVPTRILTSPKNMGISYTQTEDTRCMGRGPLDGDITTWVNDNDRTLFPETP